MRVANEGVTLDDILLLFSFFKQSIFDVQEKTHDLGVISWQKTNMKTNIFLYIEAWGGTSMNAIQQHSHLASNVIKGRCLYFSVTAALTQLIISLNEISHTMLRSHHSW